MMPAFEGVQRISVSCAAALDLCGLRGSLRGRHEDDLPDEGR